MKLNLSILEIFAQQNKFSDIERSLKISLWHLHTKNEWGQLFKISQESEMMHLY